MEKRKISLATYVVTLVIMGAVIVGLLWLNFNKDNGEKNGTKNTVSVEEVNTLPESTNKNIVDNTNEINNEKIKDILTKGNLISESEAVGAGLPSGYYFAEDGKFAYSLNEEPIKEDGQIISYRGTWKLDNNKLVLNIEEEEKAEGGKIVPEDGAVLEHLEGYKKVVSKVNKSVEYEVEILKSEDRDYLKFDKTSMYPLSTNIDQLKDLAINGYKVN